MIEDFKQFRSKEMDKKCIVVRPEADTNSEDSCVLVEKSNLSLSPRKAGFLDISRTLSSASTQNDSEHEIQIPLARK